MRAGEQRAHVERVDVAPLEALGHLALDGSCSAKPSAIAVLPTPASPTKSGLFLRRRQSTRMVRSSSSSRPISGSMLPSAARSSRLIVKSARAGPCRLGRIGALPRRSRLSSGSARSRRTSVGSRDLRDAVRDVAHHVEPGDALLLEQERGVRVGLAEHRHQHVRARRSVPCRPTGRARRRAAGRAGSRASAARSSRRPPASARASRRRSSRARASARRRRRRSGAGLSATSASCSSA